MGGWGLGAGPTRGGEQGTPAPPAMMAKAKAKVAAAAADKTAGEMKAKASELDEKHGVSAAAGAKAEQAKAKAGEMKKAAKIKAHGKVAELFYEFDADDSGWLDEEEVLAFCGSLGLVK